jgi:exodeoxyribonuclease VII small subunit
MNDLPTNHPVADMSFEEAMVELERVVAQLESGDAPLDKSIDLYERGAALRKICESRLKDAELRVQKIIQGADGAAVGTEPFDSE